MSNSSGIWRSRKRQKRNRLFPFFSLMAFLSSYLLFLKVCWHLPDSGGSSLQLLDWSCCFLPLRLVVVVLILCLCLLARRPLWAHRQRSAKRGRLTLTRKRSFILRRRLTHFFRLARFSIDTVEFVFFACFFAASFFLPGMLIWTLWAFGESLR